jgi:hypothetical protein
MAMTTTRKIASPLENITAYVEACRSGDVGTLASLFAPNALMWGFYQGEYYIGSPQLFFDEVRDNPCPADTGSTYISDISGIEQHGDIAQATLSEQGFLGANFTNLFQLARIDGSWLIVSKAYTDV